jgi:hypothetical protein
MTAKHILLNALKAIAGIAAVVFLLAPVNSVIGMLLFSVAIVVLIVCSAISSNLDDKNTGYWPDEPKL